MTSVSRTVVSHSFLAYFNILRYIIIIIYVLLLGCVVMTADAMASKAAVEGWVWTSYI